MTMCTCEVFDSCSVGGNQPINMQLLGQRMLKTQKHTTPSSISSTDVSRELSLVTLDSPIRLYRCRMSFLISKRWDMLTPSWNTSPGLAPVSSIRLGSAPAFSLPHHHQQSTPPVWEANARGQMLGRRDKTRFPLINNPSVICDVDANNEASQPPS